MTTRTETVDNRPLSDAELTDVNGGAAPLVVMAFTWGAMAGVVAGGLLAGGNTITMGDLLARHGY